jgi:PBP1b-binding outer membrane lipoprotein LpoB
MRLTLLILCIIFLSCSNEQNIVRNYEKKIEKPIVKFKITKIDTSKMVNGELDYPDTLTPQFSEIPPNPYSVVLEWNAFLPHEDNFQICIMISSLDSIVAPPTSQFLPKGYYHIEADTLVINSGMY